MEIQILNCNSIDFAKVHLTKNKLNIKFAPNGTGKSTIANALFLCSREEQLDQLMPFKLRKDNPEGRKPQVILEEQFQNVMRFNEEYVNKFVFKEDELISNSFEVLIKNEEYLQIESQIEDLIKEIRMLFNNNPDLDNLIATLIRMSGFFTLTKTGLNKKSTGVNGLSIGNKIKHIPQELELYTPFIQSEKSVTWMSWQTEGQNYLEMSDCCPFCTSSTADKKEKISKVAQEYDPKVIKNLVNIINVIDELGDYFSKDCKEKLIEITQLKVGIDTEHETYLRRVKEQIDLFLDKLNRLKMLSSFDFNDTDKLEETLELYKINFNFLSDLKSIKMESIVNPINDSIHDLKSKAGQLKGKINIQKSKVNKTIERHQRDINGFLASAGYKYNVQIIGEGDQAQLKLKHLDNVDEYLNGGSEFLSFGERNAFAIVLFMYECLAKRPDLIILDDPISSFDKNKKYAILEMLFKRDKEVCLKGKTVLMLTHDVEPIIDTLKSLAKKFKDQTEASFLQYRNGEITEFRINRQNIKTFARICKDVLESDSNDIIKLIYLRRNFELLDEQGDAYQILSNLFHRRSEPLDNRFHISDGEYYPLMEMNKINQGCADIKNYISNFSYELFLENICNKDLIISLYSETTIGYEKLQLFRILFPAEDIESSVIQKFINETYHIENEYICQLDPMEFDTIPQYVVTECDRIIHSIT
ncbi:AAA family ATPase [Acinetobacter johnsonii]|uniref:AAA family ATPase n=1 Tax=Acinetobacter johnsonii TaxID=40214 RepID=UPI0032B4A8B2